MTELVERLRDWLDNAPMSKPPYDDIREAADALENALKRISGMRDWALDKSALHHRLAHENEHLRVEHIASSTAYRNLADEVAALLPNSLDGN